MTKKVLIIAGSPRKGGNSDTLCDQFKKGAEETGAIVEKIYLSDQNIHYCIGCNACQDTHCCFQKDDMQGILGKMKEADVIVLATPVYFYTMSAQMKTMIDRSVPMYLQLMNKEFYFIATAAEPKEEMERTIDSLRGFTDCLPNAVVKGVIYGGNAWKIGDIQKQPAMILAYEMGRNAV